MADRDTAESLGVPPISERTFWGIFAGAWLAFLTLFCTVGYALEGGSVGWALTVGALNAGPPALVATLIALRRRDLLRPERTLGRTVLVHVCVGAVFAVTTGLMVTVLATGLGFEEPGLSDMGWLGAIAYRSVTGVFLYAILAGYLMWAESLRRVHESRTVAAREAVLRAQAEAKAVRAQFNPHFVFNTLHSLMLLVRADPDRAEQAIEDVATLIRYASILQRRDVDAVPLAKELEVARRYVELEKLRLEDRLRVSWDVPAEVHGMAVPSFALQTLMENAIKHGIEPRARGGAVEVAATIHGDMLDVTVRDDGEGADPARVRAAAGHGLDLLRRRLAAVHAESATLTWDTAPGAGFSVTVRLPARTAPPVEELSLIYPAEVAG